MDRLRKRHLKVYLKKYDIGETVIDKIMEGNIFAICDSEIRDVLCKIKGTEILKIDDEPISLSGKRDEKLFVLFLNKDEAKDTLYDENADHCIFGEDMDDTLFEELVGMIFDINVLTDKRHVSYYRCSKHGKSKGQWRKDLKLGAGTMFPSGDNVLKQFESRLTKEAIQEAMVLGIIGSEIGKKSSDKSEKKE
jgi:hypothetical protein